MVVALVSFPVKVELTSGRVVVMTLVGSDISIISCNSRIDFWKSSSGISIVSWKSRIDFWKSGSKSGCCRLGKSSNNSYWYCVKITTKNQS